MGRILSLGMVLALVGCQATSGPRYVTKKGDTGVVAISSNTPDERSRGLSLIAKHVGPQFVIDMEEVVPLKAAAKPKDRLAPEEFLGLAPVPTSEHHIHYHRSKPAMSLPVPTHPSSVVPASHTETSRETTPPSSQSKSFLPLTCVGCQGP